MAAPQPYRIGRDRRELSQTSGLKIKQTFVQIKEANEREQTDEIESSRAPSHNFEERAEAELGHQGTLKTKRTVKIQETKKEGLKDSEVAGDR